MGHWTNSTQQTLSAASGEVTIVDFDTELIPGSQVALQDGVYDYAYHVNLIKPTGEIGPSRVKGTIGIKRAGKPGVDRPFETIDFIAIDSGEEASLAHAGQVPMSAGDEIQVRINLDDLSQSGVLQTKIRKDRSSLFFDLAGASASGNFAGTAFPTQPSVSGQSFYRTDLVEEFHFTGTKWLGSMRADGGGRNGNLPANSYLRRYNGMVMSASLGIYMPFDATITCLSWTKGNGTAGDIEIHRDGTSLVAVDATAVGGGVDLDVDFDADGVLSLFWASASSASNVQVTIHYRRRG